MTSHAVVGMKVETAIEPQGRHHERSRGDGHTQGCDRAVLRPVDRPNGLDIAVPGRCGHHDARFRTRATRRHQARQAGGRGPQGRNLIGGPLGASRRRSRNKEHHERDQQMDGHAGSQTMC